MAIPNQRNRNKVKKVFHLVHILTALQPYSLLAYSVSRTYPRRTQSTLLLEGIHEYYNALTYFRASSRLNSIQHTSKEEDEVDEEYSNLEPPPSKLTLEDDEEDLLYSSRSSLLQINDLTVSQLKQQLRLRGLRVSGTKSQLIQRLSQAIDPRLSIRDNDDDDDDVTVVEDWTSSLSSSWDDEDTSTTSKTSNNQKKFSSTTRKSNSKAEQFAKQRGKEFVDVSEYLDEKDKGKESKSFYVNNPPSSDSDEVSSYSSSSPETWGDEAKIIDDYEGKSIIVDSLSRTIIQYRGSNHTMVEAYVVASKDSLKSFLAGGNRYGSYTSKNTTAEIEKQIQDIQLNKEKATKLPRKMDDMDGVDEDDEEGHYTHVMERDYGDWGKYSMTGEQFSSQEIKGLLLLTDLLYDDHDDNDDGPFTESTKRLADQIAFELQPMVVMVPDLFRGNVARMMDSSDSQQQKQQEWFENKHPHLRVSVDIRAAAAALRRQYGVNNVGILGMGYGGGKALEMAGRVYPGNVLDDVGGVVGPPHVNPSAVVSWYPTNYNATLLFGQDRISLEAFDDYQTSVMALFAEEDTLMGATTKDAEILKNLLSQDERIKDMMVKVFSRQKHGFAQEVHAMVHNDEFNRLDQNEYGGEYTSLDSSDTEAAYLLSSAFLETYSRSFLPTVGPPIEDDDNWSDLHMKDLSASRLKNVRSDIENMLAKHEGTDLDLGRMHPLDYMNPISDMEDVDKTLADAMKNKPYGLSPEDDADTMVEKLKAALDRGDLEFLPGFGEIPMDDTEDAYW